ncbi:MAG: hypothetical protein HGA60_00505 [Chlorobiaceae bacterium]|nr:hypothetical protein [Chlorobiaceae bacterium]
MNALLESELLIIDLLGIVLKSCDHPARVAGKGRYMPHHVSCKRAYLFQPKLFRRMGSDSMPVMGHASIYGNTVVIIWEMARHDPSL